MREHLERVAVVLDEVMAEATGALTPWENVEWLRLHADLLDRLGAAAGPTSAVSGRGELVRDRAERLADRLNGLSWVGGGEVATTNGVNLPVAELSDAVPAARQQG